MADAIFRHGEPVMVDYTAGADIAAGQVILQDNQVVIAHRPISNTEKAAVAAHGGVYEVTAAGNYNAGTKVWWDDSGKKVTTTSTNNVVFGFTAQATTTNTTGLILHHPV